jgi:MSHA pilin protein MshC
MDMTRHAKGFTLIELIMVMVLLGVLAAIASMRMPGDGINVSAQAEQLASDIRYTQSLAMSRGQRFRINFAAGSYQITDISGTVAQVHPGTGQTAAVDLAPAVLSGYNPPFTNSYLAFDSLGVPYTDTTIAQAVLATLTLTSGGEAITVRVAPQTGRVQVQ